MARCVQPPSALGPRRWAPSTAGPEIEHSLIYARLCRLRSTPEEHLENDSRADLAFCPEGSAPLVHDSLNGGEAESCSLSFFFRSEEGQRPFVVHRGQFARFPDHFIRAPNDSERNHRLKPDQIYLIFLGASSLFGRFHFNFSSGSSQTRSPPVKAVELSPKRLPSGNVFNSFAFPPPRTT